MPSDMSYRKNFGGWGNALRAAGFEPHKPFPSDKCRENTIKAHKGKRSFNWKGGRRKTEHGYIEVWKPNHVNANKKGYILEHRLIISDHLNRKIEPNEEVHHVNGIKDDNRLENLELLFKAAHTVITHKGINRPKKGSVECSFSDCNKLTASKYGLCTKHYKVQWQRVKFGLITNIHENKELLEVVPND